MKLFSSNPVQWMIRQYQPPQQATNEEEKSLKSANVYSNSVAQNFEPQSLAGLLWVTFLTIRYTH